MTSLWKTYNLDTSNFDRFFVGADQMLKSLREKSEWIANNAAASYPPFNLKKTDENKYVIEMAVAGFGKQDLEIELADNKLIIKGNSSADTKDAKEYLHMGIANRAFTRQFTLADNVEINNAEMLNGMLRIWLDRIIPEDKKPKKIEINDTNEETVKKSAKSAKSQTFLTE
jgi:molecular chaperone IbpA